MKIEFFHDEEDIVKSIENVVITDKDVDFTDEEIKMTLVAFTRQVQGFDFGLLLSFLNVNKGKQITKITELAEEAINVLGWNKFAEFARVLDVIVQESIAEKRAQENQPEPEPETQA